MMQFASPALEAIGEMCGYQAVTVLSGRIGLYLLQRDPLYLESVHDRQGHSGAPYEADKCRMQCRLSSLLDLA